MEKLIAAFEKSPTLANAKKLILHVKRHPMCECMMEKEDWKTYSNAYQLTLGGN